MIISTVYHHEAFLPKPDITRILGIPTYDAHHQIQIELKNNALSLHYNLGGATCGHPRQLMMNTKYATLSNVMYVRPVQPVILLISNNTTRIELYKLI